MSSSDFRPVRVTPTNAGPDSKGIVSVFGWDLEGMVAFYLVGGALVGMLVILATAGQSFIARIGFALIPFALSAVWVRIFVHGRPPSYQADVLEGWLRGPHFRLRPQTWCGRLHPRTALWLRVISREETDRG